MSLKQKIRDRVRVLNKHFTNKVMIHLCGRSFGHFAILTHEGRKTGRQYRIPIIAEPVEDGFVIALTYGRKVDWAANVLAKGGASVFWKHREYSLTRPEYIEREAGLQAFPPVLRTALRAAGTVDFMRLRKLAP
jgi:deazaflavin-dependent oxidoreductase (nitroreductase family)